MARFARRTGFRRRVRRNFQWARLTSNDVTVVVPPAFYQEDLLSSFKAAYGFSINFPDISIWRVRLRISVAIKWTAGVVNPETAGVIVGVFVDAPTVQTLASVGLQPYAEKYMYYHAHYYSEAIMGGGRVPAANIVDFYTFPIDIKVKRRFANIDDTLVLQVAPTGAAVASLNGLSWTSSVLMSLGRR